MHRVVQDRLTRSPGIVVWTTTAVLLKGYGPLAPIWVQSKPQSSQVAQSDSSFRQCTQPCSSWKCTSCCSGLFICQVGEKMSHQRLSRLEPAHDSPVRTQPSYAARPTDPPASHARTEQLVSLRIDRWTRHIVAQMTGHLQRGLFTQQSKMLCPQQHAQATARGRH